VFTVFTTKLQFFYPPTSLLLQEGSLPDHWPLFWQILCLSPSKTYPVKQL